MSPIFDSQKDRCTNSMLDSPTEFSSHMSVTLLDVSNVILNWKNVFNSI